MTEIKTPRAALVQLTKAARYAEDLLDVFDRMPRDRAHAFAWKFLMDKAKEFGTELETLKKRA